MKKLLLLGGSAQQCIAIETAKRLGYGTVLCDFLQDNPGRSCADRYYPVSTTDPEAVLAVARKEAVAGVLSYASDPAAPVAAYVAEVLGLPSNPLSSVETLCDKELFRQFLHEHAFCVPNAGAFSSVEDAMYALSRGAFRFPVMVKPVDSSGSRGVGRLDQLSGAEAMLRAAMSFSRKRRILIEEYVAHAFYQVAGDGLSIDGRLLFSCFGNDHFNPSAPSPYVPIAASFPSVLSEETKEGIRREIQRLLTLLHMGTCTYNFDIRLSEDKQVYLMEVAPRDGGNYIPDVIREMTGVDLVACSVKAAMGERLSISPGREEGFWAYYAVHSLEDGVLSRIEIDETVAKKNIMKRFMRCFPGDTVRGFSYASETLGVFLMRFGSMEEMLDRMEHSAKWIQVVVQPKG